MFLAWLTASSHSGHSSNVISLEMPSLASLFTTQSLSTKFPCRALTKSDILCLFAYCLPLTEAVTLPVLFTTTSTTYSFLNPSLLSKWKGCYFSPPSFSYWDFDKKKKKNHKHVTWQLKGSWDYLFPSFHLGLGKWRLEVQDDLPNIIQLIRGRVQTKARSHDSIWRSLHKNCGQGQVPKTIGLCGSVNRKKECMVKGGGRAQEENIIRLHKITGIGNKIPQ